MKKRIFKMSGQVWLYPGETASWHFITLPKEEAGILKEQFGKHARGWGSLPVRTTLGKTVWETSIFPDKRFASYLLPLKASIRKAEGVKAGDTVKFTLELR